MSVFVPLLDLGLNKKIFSYPTQLSGPITVEWLGNISNLGVLALFVLGGGLHGDDHKPRGCSTDNEQCLLASLCRCPSPSTWTSTICARRQNLRRKLP